MDARVRDRRQRRRLETKKIKALYGVIAFVSYNMETLQSHVDACGDENIRKALVLAASRGDETTVRALVELGAQVNTVFSGGTTALMVAAQHGHESMFRARWSLVRRWTLLAVKDRRR